MNDDIFYTLIISPIFFISFFLALAGFKLKIGKSDKYIHGLTLGVVSMMLFYTILPFLEPSIPSSYTIHSFIITFFIFFVSHKIFHSKHLVYEHVNDNGIENGIDIEKRVYLEKQNILGVSLYFLFFSIISFFKGLSLLTFDPTYILAALLSIGIYKTVESLLIGFKSNTFRLNSCLSLFLITFYSLYTPLGMLIGYFYRDFVIEIFKSDNITSTINGSFLGCLTFICTQSFHYLFLKENFVKENREGNRKFACSKLFKAFFWVFVGLIIGSCVFITYGIDMELRDDSYVLRNNTDLTSKPVLNINSTSFEHIYNAISHLVTKNFQ